MTAAQACAALHVTLWMRSRQLSQAAADSVLQRRREKPVTAAELFAEMQKAARSVLGDGNSTVLDKQAATTAKSLLITWATDAKEVAADPVRAGLAKEAREIATRFIEGGAFAALVTRERARLDFCVRH